MTSWLTRSTQSRASRFHQQGSSLINSRALQWRHNGHDGISNHQPHHCLLNRLFGRRSKKSSKLRVSGLCVGNSPGTGEFPAQMASKTENVSIWWRHHAKTTHDKWNLNHNTTTSKWKDAFVNVVCETAAIVSWPRYAINLWHRNL